MLPLAAIGSIASSTGPSIVSSFSAVAETATKSFGQVLGELTTGAVDALGKAEASSIAGLQGKASLQGVVDSITQAEQTLQTVIAVRDKAVSAWSEISRMSI